MSWLTRAGVEEPEVELCKGCNTMKHVNDKGLCGRCSPHPTNDSPAFEALDFIGTVERLNRTVRYIDRRKAELETALKDGGKHG